MIGILGGTFDPPHWGHIRLAKNFIDSLGLTQLIWLPAGQPWQKSSLITSAELRLQMTNAAAMDLKELYESSPCPAEISVCRLELDRVGPSYTIDTARELRDLYGKDQALVWLMGADSYQNLPSWNDWQKLPDFLHLAVASRRISPVKGQAYHDPKYPETIDEIIAIFDQRMTHDVRDLKEKPFGKIFFDESFHVDLSSTQLREQLHHDWAKENLMSALSPNVLECIFAQNIYASFN
jgi:nicotinate-nucleotide adenylyltransferase